MDSAHAKREFTPALGFHFLTRQYDRVIATSMQESTFRKLLVRRVMENSPDSVLDLGCGTGSFLSLLAAHQPTIRLTGVDIDPNVLELARAKFADSIVDITFTHAPATKLPFADSTFAVVTSTLLFHHLLADQKSIALTEILRVLKPGGELFLLDWGTARNLYDRAKYLSIQLLDGFETTNEHVTGAFQQRLTTSGFSYVEELDSLSTVFGRLSLWRGER